MPHLRIYHHNGTVTQPIFLPLIADIMNDCFILLFLIENKKSNYTTKKENYSSYFYLECFYNIIFLKYLFNIKPTKFQEKLKINIIYLKDSLEVNFLIK